VWDRQQAARATRPAGARGGGSAVDGKDSDIIPIGALGSGSDFAAFIDHLGITTVSLGFGGEDRGGTYHSAYDTPWYIEHFGDKESLYGKALADTAGTLVMRFADADILPYDFRNLATTLNGYSGEIKALIKQMQRDAATRKHNIDSGYYRLATDPQKALQPLGLLPSPPDMDFTALDAAIAKLSTASGSLSAAKAGKINGELARAEQKFLSPNGLPRRPWVQHVLYAPGWYTGYGVKTMPGIREAIEDGRFDEAKQQMEIVTTAVQSEADYITLIAQELQTK
jgi:N-acetylated-alpha-linked acidic dipeptidase